MTAVRRWCLAALVTGLAVATPFVVRSLPADDSDVGAGELLMLVSAAEDRPYVGYVETSGVLQLPSADRFDGVGALLGERNRLRVWWRSRDAWRVSRLLTAGETDLVHTRDGLTREFDYEDGEASATRDPDIRLPRTSDLLPPEVARRFLDGVAADDVRRLPARRVAGRSAPGLRVEGTPGESSIGRVDVWADPDTGVPLRVEVFARGSASPDFTTTFLDFSGDEPDRDTVQPRLSDSTPTSYDEVLDIADAVNQYAPVQVPERVAGLRRTSATRGAVGVYGEGLTQLIAMPLRDREADPLRDQLRTTPGSVPVPVGTAVDVGPLGVLLSGEDGEGGWLVAGTVTRPVLSRAVRDLLRGATYAEGLR